MFKHLPLVFLVKNLQCLSSDPWIFFNALTLVTRTQGAAAMTVNVGSFSNPEGLEGLAHFLGTNYLIPSECLLLSACPGAIIELESCLFKLIVGFIFEKVYVNCGSLARKPL